MVKNQFPSGDETAQLFIKTISYEDSGVQQKINSIYEKGTIIGISPKPMRNKFQIFRNGFNRRSHGVAQYNGGKVGGKEQ